ncbi:MAG: DUF1631 domain-containing protein, partial [Gammaproteobacteria bacterium]
MSSIPDNSNIVSFNSRQPAAATPAVSDRLGEPLQTIREVLLKRFSQLCGTMFDSVDDALFDRAEHTQAGAQQTEFFDGMRETRKKRQRAERLTLDRISQLFVDFGLGRIQAPLAAPSREASGGLSLVEDDDLEEVLAISTMVTKAETRLAEPLSALCRRFSALRGGAVVENATNPVGPAQLCDAFRRGVDQLEVGVSVRLIIYKLFERHVMAGLDPIYDEINVKFVEAGVLPQLRYAPAPSAAPPPTARRVNVADQVAALSPDTEYAAAAPSGIEAEIYQTLRSLLAMRHAPAPAASIDDFAAPARPSLAPTALLSALQILQNQSVQMQARAAAEAIPSGLGGSMAAVASAMQLKQALFEETDRMQAGPKARVASVDEDTIDLVGMVFEFIVQDRNLPSEMQALLARLQIPYLKVALLDRHLFTQKSHPARQLLDSMAQACIGKAEGAEADTALHNKIRDIVETIMRDFDDDVGLIERANEDFTQFLEGARRRIELAEKRTTESIQGREKLEYARRLAAGEMRKRCESKDLPPLVHGLLNGPFAQFLVQIALRQGDKSVEWKQALGFADAVAWSTLPKTTDADVNRLKNLAPSMLNYMYQSLGKIGWQDADTHDMIGEFDALFKRQITPPNAPADIDIAAATFAPLTRAGAVTAPMPANDAPTAIVGNLIGLMQKSVIKQEEPEPEPVAPAAVAEDHVTQVKAMKVGTWVEFNNPQTGAKERAKLSWISPISSKYLFVDRKGLKVADKTVADLAAMFAAGHVTPLDDSMP